MERCVPPCNDATHTPSPTRMPTHVQHNEAGRGCELSELVLYHDRLYAFDDRTGIQFEIVNHAHSHPQPDAHGKVAAPALVPRLMLMEGNGVTDKGHKIEWATVRGDMLYVGSFGKEFTDNAGHIQHANNLWVKTVTADGVVSHVSWESSYNAMRQALGYSHPG